MTKKINLEELQQTAETLKNYIDDTLTNNMNKLAIVCGDKQEGDTSDAQRIQRAIDSSSEGDIIKFPNGEIIIDNIINLKPNRTYIGNGWGSSIKAADNANLAEMIHLVHSENNYRTIIKDIKLDGNKSNNGAATGLYIGSIVHGIIENVYATYCSGTGIYIDGKSTFRSNTTDILNCRALGCGGYGLYISEYCEDVHVIQGDYGMNTSDGICFKCPSSSIRDVTVWANMGNGINIDINAVGCQIWNSQVEGNALMGIYVTASFTFISGNKIYDNSNIEANYGKYDGIYINAYEAAYKDNYMEGVTITGNKIYSGLYSNTGYHRYALCIDKYHKNFSIYGNDLLFQGNGKIDTTRPLVYGLNDTDKSDYSWITAFTKLNLVKGQSIEGFKSSTLKFITLTDTGKLFDGNSTITIKESGYYKISCYIHLDNCIVGTYNYIEYNVNGVTKARIAGGYGGDTGFLTLSGEDIVFLEKGDKITVNCFSTNNTVVNENHYLSTVTFTKYAI